MKAVFAVRDEFVSVEIFKGRDESILGGDYINFDRWIELLSQMGFFKGIFKIRFWDHGSATVVESESLCIVRWG